MAYNLTRKRAARIYCLMSKKYLEFNSILNILFADGEDSRTGAISKFFFDQNLF